jgi:ribosome-associated translation inhibitor RaiA
MTPPFEREEHRMLVQVNAGNGTHVQSDVAARIEGNVKAALEQYANEVRRVDVHLSDENHDKGGDDDKRCMMEALIVGHGRIAVTNFAGDLPLAIDGAVEKLGKAIGRELGRLRAG